MTQGDMLIRHARILTPFRTLENGSVCIRQGRIAEAGADRGPLPGERVVDAGGLWLAPGWIDLHVHGGGGHDFMDATPDAFLGASAVHARHGTTAMVPTTLTSTPESLERTLMAFSGARRVRGKGAALLGFHLEGPYFSPQWAGAQDPRYLRVPDPEEYLPLLERYPEIIRWSAAPELPGALAFGMELNRRGVLASIAHSDASTLQVAEAMEHGYRLVTHLYSAMSGVRRIHGHRQGGVIEAAWLYDNLPVELIADGMHLPPELLRLAWQIKGPAGVVLVTDAMRGAGMPEGPSVLGSLSDGLSVQVDQGVAWLPDRTAFAGSVATGDRLIRTMTQQAGVPLGDAVRMMTATPATVAGCHRHKGTIASGMDADIVLFDDGIHVRMTLCEGHVVWADPDFFGPGDVQCTP